MIKTNDSFAEGMDNLMPIFGRNAVLEALKGSMTIDAVLIADFDAGGQIPEIIARAKTKGILVKQADHRKLDEMSGGGVHQGVAATVAATEYVDLDALFAVAEQRGEAPFFIIADEIEDPHNLGALIRTADAAGVHGVIIPKRRSAMVNATVFKTSAGACAHVAIAKVSNIAETIERLKERNVWVYGAHMDGTSLWSTDLSGAVAIVVGSEGRGLGELVKKRCDALVKLPMVGQVNSLNASVAGGLLMYEVVRRRQK